MIGNKRLVIILVFLIVVLSNCTYAISIFNTTSPGLKSVFSGWLYGGNSIDTDGELFEASFGMSGSLGYFFSENYSMFVRENNCDVKGTYGACLDSVGTYGDRRKGYVRFYRVIANLVVEKTIPDLTPLLNDTQEITLKITNNGYYPASNVTVEDSFSEEIEISNVVYPCFLSGNTIYFSGNIKRDNFVECRYEITPLKEIKYVQKTRKRYFNGVENIDGYATAITYDVEDYITPNIFFNQTDPDVKEPIMMNITLTNNYNNNTIYVTDLSILVSNKIGVIDHSLDLSETTNSIYKIDGRLAFSDKVNYFMEIYPKFKGEYTIKLFGKYEVDGYPNQFNFVADEFEVDMEEIEN